MKRTLNRKTIVLILVLGILGQIAWGLENSWFNTFTYDVITKETWPIALMNGASALTATVTTFWMGTVSDRAGKRKPFIQYGYLIWGIATAGFLLSEYFPTVLSRCIMVVVLDCVMTYFGSTAYDACFNAWTTDISDDSNRGKISALIQLAPIGAQVLLVGAGAVIDTFGYNAFFLFTGILVSITGLIAGHFLKDADSLKPTVKEDHIFTSILKSFSFRSIHENRDLFLVLSAACVQLIGFQVVYAYEMIYANQYLGIAKTWATLLSAAGLPIMIIGGAWAGRKADEGKGTLPLWIAPGMFAIGAFLHALAKGLVLVIIARAFFYGGYMIMNIAVTALFKKLEPADARGRFEGVRMIFMVLLPMIIGPSIGSALLSHYSISPSIYWMSGIVGLLTYLPVVLISGRMRRKAVESDSE